MGKIRISIETPVLTQEDKDRLHMLGAWCHFGECQFRRRCGTYNLDDMESDDMEIYMDVCHEMFSPIDNEAKRAEREEVYRWRAVMSGMSRKRNAERKGWKRAAARRAASVRYEDSAPNKTKRNKKRK